MDLWIRSQDKTDLVKANALWIMDNQIWMEVPFYENHKKLGLTVTGHNHKLAEYATKERALEVLGEIDERIMLLNTLSIAKDRDTLLALKNALPEEKLQGLAYPYEMPKE